MKFIHPARIKRAILLMRAGALRLTVKLRWPISNRIQDKLNITSSII